MPMSPRLLRPRASGVVLPSDADARAYVLAVNTADGQPLEPLVVQAIDAFVIGCKADGIWTAIKAGCVLMGARTLSGALTPLVGSAPTNNNFVAGDYNRKTGLIGDGSTKYLHTNRNNNSDPQDNMHAAFYVSAWGAGGALPMSLFGGGGTGTGSTVIVRSRTETDGTVFFRNRRATTDPQTPPFSSGATAAAGFFGMQRNGASSFIFRSASASVTHTRTSEAPGSQPFFVFARSSSAGTAAEQHAAHRVAFYSIGESLTLSSLDSRITTLYNAIGAAIP